MEGKENPIKDEVSMSEGGKSDAGTIPETSETDQTSTGESESTPDVIIMDDSSKSEGNSISPPPPLNFTFSPPIFIKKLPESTTRPFICKQTPCKNSNPRVSFRTVREYTRHVNRHHSDRKSDPGKDPSSFICSQTFCKDVIPPSSFLFEDDFSEHVRICHGVYETESEVPSTSKDPIQASEGTSGTRDKEEPGTVGSPRKPNKFKCGFCREQFAFWEDFKQHIIWQHTPPEEYLCTSCDLIFPSENELHLHQENFHSSTSM